MLARSSLALTLLALAAASAAAQDTTRAPHASVLSVQPMLAIGGIFAGEFERAVTPAVTVGLGGTAWFPGVASYTSVDVKGRYYVDDTPFSGLSIGASVGMTRISESVGLGYRVSGPTVGAMLDYGWLLGSKRALHLAVGFGAKVIIASASGLTEDVPFRYPTARLSVGRAF